MTGPGTPTQEPAPQIAGPEWDRLVESDASGTFYQLDAWARIKAATGWSPVRWRLDPTLAPTMALLGAQLLVTRRAPLPWGFAYGPRAPFGLRLEERTVGEFTKGIRGALKDQKIGLVRIDPEVEAGGPLDRDGAFVRALGAAGWQPAPPVQRPDTWLLDLKPGEDELWHGLRKKWRQYVNRARSHGVQVRAAGRDALPAFHQLMTGTAGRMGFVARSLETFERMWDELEPEARVGLLFADSPAGEPIASLFLVRCGGRLSEPWGGYTAAAGELHANYLLKWESIRQAASGGLTEYDMCGLVNPGITYFKSGFGGRAIQYVGAWDLDLDRLGARAWRAASGAAAGLRRFGRGRASSSAGGDGDGDA
jgi:lipid II:glycine glycyltransferase (peptidoglycan interpeptide bridge formation enzyme)